MPIIVTDYTCLLKLDIYSEVVYIQKSKLSVMAFGDNVQIRWDADHHFTFPYDQYQSPTGASAVAVAAAITALINASCNGGGGGGGGGGNTNNWIQFQTTFADAALVGKSTTNFAVFADNGSGTLVKLDVSKYTFDPGTGTVNIINPSGNYRIHFLS